ncbi:MAG: CHC2 zinc finger domain-containing protein [Hyphomicrobiaceae bacterium]
MKTEHAKRVYFEQLKRLVPLTMVLAHYSVELRKQGQQLYGPCPIHRGSNKRQFSVNPATSEWHCFGDCDRGGAMLEFVAAMEHVEILEAARLVARWFALGASDQPHNQHQERSRKMSDNQKPALRIYSIEEREGKDDFWHPVGAMWPDSKGGYQIRIPPGISVTGRLAARPIKDTEEDDDKSAKYKKK